MTVPVPDILVRNCTVRVHRRGGWAWGDPQKILDRVLAAVEEALADAAAQAGVTEYDELVLREPVRLAVGAGSPGELIITASEVDLTEQLREELVRSRGAETVSAEVAAGPDWASAVTDAAEHAVRARAIAVLGRALGDWSRDDRLTAIVDAWPRPVRDAWLRAIEQASADPDGTLQAWTAVAVASIADRLAVEGDPPVDAATRSLLLAGALAAAAEGRLPDSVAFAEARRLVGAPTREAEFRAARQAGPVVPPIAPAPAPAEDESTFVPRPAVRRSDAAVVSPALPFLVVLQLHRLDYLVPASAALHVSGLPAANAMLPALLAGKILAPPANGWRRDPADRDAVSLVADMPAGTIAELLSGWAPAAAIAVPAMAATLAALYADDLDPHGLVVTRDDEGGWLCGERSGLLVGWGAGDAELAVLLRQLCDPDVIEGELFAGIAAALAPRRGAPGLAVKELECHLGAAVGAALGSLSTELWGPGADAVLALDRLADLEARISVSEQGVTIALPRGQRWLDLRRAGLLDAWPAPWAPGSRWELVTW